MTQTGNVDAGSLHSQTSTTKRIAGRSSVSGLSETVVVEKQATMTMLTKARHGVARVENRNATKGTQ